jgi:hypothetical protein
MDVANGIVQILWENAAGLNLGHDQISGHF